MIIMRGRGKFFQLYLADFKLEGFGDGAYIYCYLSCSAPAIDNLNRNHTIQNPNTCNLRGDNFIY